MQLMTVNQSAIDNQPVNQPAIETALTVITEMEKKKQITCGRKLKLHSSLLVRMALGDAGELPMTK